MSIRGRKALFPTVATGAVALICGAAPALAKPLHVVYAGSYATPPTTAECVANQGVACYGPNQFQVAFDMKRLYSAGLTGAGKTIVVVDSFGSPTIRHDLQEFDTQNGLPAPPKFDIIHPVGAIPPFDKGNATMVNWAIETSLDVEYAHTMAPGANILLVETPVAETEGTTGFPQIIEAENYVIDHGLGDVISQSFGATEETFPSKQSILDLRSAYKNAQANNVTVVSGSGDQGPTNAELNGINLYPRRVNFWPSTDPLVTSVGGIQLHLDQNGIRLAPDNVWNDTALLGAPAASGGGVSSVFSRPSYQDGVASIVGDARGTPDISLSAAVNGGALVYMSFEGLHSFGLAKGYSIIGGTSEATPEFAGVVAVADQAAGHDLGLVNPALYGLGSGSPGIPDITIGNTTVSFTNSFSGASITVPGFDAVPGYDLASGLGTADGWELAGALSR